MLKLNAKIQSIRYGINPRRFDRVGLTISVLYRLPCDDDYSCDGFFWTLRTRKNSCGRSRWPAYRH